MVEEILDVPFSATFPLPFRVLFLGGLGILAWATNLHGLDAAGLDTIGALDLTTPFPALPLSSPLRLGASRPVLSSARGVYAPIYRLAAVYWAWALGTWALFRLATGGDPARADEFKFIPSVAIIGALVFLVAPWDAGGKRERDLFLLAVRRCLLPTTGRPVYFSDVILADIFTSFAKVLGDVWLSACMLLPQGSLRVLPALHGLSRWILPTIMSLPYLIRLRQCLVDYSAPSNTTRRPLWNALKYATAFPVIFLSAAQRIVASDLAGVAEDAAWVARLRIFQFWLFFAAVNSFYSYWWDVTNDWGLEVLAPHRASELALSKRQSLPRPLVLPALHGKVPGDDALSSPAAAGAGSSSSPSLSTGSGVTGAAATPYPWGLRRVLLFSLPVYPLLVFTNLVLRLTWSLKLSAHLHTGASAEGSAGILWLEVCELARRWAWVFLRVEWELVRRGARVGSVLSPGGGHGRLPGEEYELVFVDDEEGEQGRA